ncbi:MAG: hypothetical protein KF729_14740 [Sandaracinaceae bacterium]|nr:hypothetical protein [Sandaracinaceae bacterium]
MAVTSGGGGARGLALACALACVPAAALAQEATGDGYELALDGPTEVRLGRPARYRGVAYGVRGLARLAPIAAPVSARFVEPRRGGRSGPRVEVRAGADGRFTLDVPVPTGLGDEVSLELVVGPERGGRTFRMPVRTRPAVVLVLRTDRQLYEPGEPAHVWAWLRDEASGRPIPAQQVELDVEGTSMPASRQRVATGPSGVAHLALAVPRGAPLGSMRVRARVEGQLELTTHFNVGTRTWERIFARVEVEPEPVAPGAEATALVTVTATSGAPVAGADVSVTIERAVFTGRTQADGVARVGLRAPVYLEHDTGTLPVEAEARHPGHGSVRALGRLRLAVPLSLSMEVVARHGALVPELDDLVYVRLRDGLGNPPAQPTEVTLEGSAVPSGRARATTDANGIAAIPVRLPPGASTANGELGRTSLLVTASGPLERVARVELPVLEEAEVLPTPDRPVLDPGSRLAIELARRPRVARRALVIELLDPVGHLVALEHVAAGARRVELALPADRVGLFTVRARAVHADETLEGTGGTARVIVRPAAPDFVDVTPARVRWTVGETARVTLGTGAGGPRRWAAVLVRDLAAHGGELAFVHHFLERRFEQALLTPSDEDGRRLVSAVLAAATPADAKPSPAAPLADALGLASRAALSPPRGGLRDPWPLARELERRGVTRPMRALERRLAEALDAGGLDAVTTVTAGRRALREDLLGPGVRALGDVPITASMLEAADPSFTYDAVARRVARARLVRLLVALSHYLDPGDDAPPAARVAAREPPARWLPRLVERGLLRATDLDDPWGGRFALRPAARPVFALSPHATSVELVSAGPDGRFGTADDVRDPFARAVPRGTPYALASGEDALMRRLAVLSPVERTLAAIGESYARISAEMTEDEIGDAVAAEISEGTIGLGSLGTIGHGGGGGSGSGYGSGSGSLRGRSARTPQVRTGAAAISGLAAVLRERFPPTLLFAPAVEVDPSGATELAIPLADAVTTYLVEVVVWREDGWVWSGSTRIEVDREIVVSAPVPEAAHAGDRIGLPVRVSNHGATARELEVRVGGVPALGIAPSPAQRLRLDPGEARAIEVELAPEQNGEGSIEIVVATPEGEALDAVRLPMRVVDVARWVERTERRLGAGRVAFAMEVPAGADPRGGSIEVGAGARLFEPSRTAHAWTRWAPAAGVPAEPDLDAGGATELALSIGTAWLDASQDDALVEDALERLTGLLVQAGATDPGSSAAQEARAWALFGLAPIGRAPARRELASGHALVDRLRGDVGAWALASTEPSHWVLGAAALAWGARGEAELERARELARRLERHVVVVGDDRWLALDAAALRASALLALAELSIGRHAQAASVLLTLARWEESGVALEPDVSALARAGVRRMLRGRAPARVTVTIDGAARTVELEGGVARVDAPELARPGAHEIRVEAEGGAPIVARAEARYGVSWDAPAGRGPLALALEGEPAGLDDVSRFTLVVRNRAPRTLARPLVDVQLPTGAELATDTPTPGARLRRVEDRVAIELGALLPGQERRVPLALRFRVAGALRGLGVSGRAADRPDAASVLVPRTVTIREVSR